jgi:hypothetical protein
MRLPIGCDPPRKTEPQEVGNLGLRGSVGAGFSGPVSVNVTQVMISSSRLEDMCCFGHCSAAAVRCESAKRVQIQLGQAVLKTARPYGVRLSFETLGMVDGLGLRRFQRSH